MSNKSLDHVTELHVSAFNLKYSIHLRSPSFFSACFSFSDIDCQIKT